MRQHRYRDETMACVTAPTCAVSAWRPCVRLARCLTDPTYVNDHIRREHSPPPLVNTL